jgi:hypothetical protein
MCSIDAERVEQAEGVGRQIAPVYAGRPGG